MNIAIFTDTYPPFINGVSTSCYNLVKVLKAHGHNVTVVTARAEDGKLEYKDDVIYMPGLKAKNFYGYRLTKVYDTKVMEILRSRKIEVIHNQTDVSVGAFGRRAAKVLNVPLVYTYHTSYEDYTYIVTHGVLDRVAKKTIRLYSMQIAKNATEFITPSDKTKTFIRNVGYDGYINVIPTGIDFSLFDNKNIDQNEILEFKKNHNIDQDTKVLLLLGRTAKEKSMDVTIKFFAGFLKRNPNIKMKLLIVGDGPGRGELELLSHELGLGDRVEFLGSCLAERVPFYYHLADIYTSASTTETQGLTFMESMAAGTTVLARFDDNLCETIIDGETGFFFTDETSFEEKMKKILSLSDEEKSKIAQNAFKIIDMYSLEKFYENILEVYERAVKKNW